MHRRRRSRRHSIDLTMPDWAGLPFDLIRNVTLRLHAATDFVRFHAVCKPWRDAVPPQPSYPTFLPFLVAPRDVSGHRSALCVFSSSSSRRSAGANAITLRDRRWLTGADDGTAKRFVADAARKPRGGQEYDDPITGAATPLPPFPEDVARWADRAGVGVGEDGTSLLYRLHNSIFKVASLRPGDDAWTVEQWPGLIFPGERSRCTAAYHGGRILVSAGSYMQRIRFGSADVASGSPFHVVGHLLVSRGELLYASVQAEYHSINKDSRGFTTLLSVAVYALDEGGAGGKPAWVRRDGGSFADRVLFLGRPSSFAMDAAKLGVDGEGGCAYFVDDRKAFYGKAPVKRCRVYRYSFVDGKSELVEQLPADWIDDACMWVTPQPAAIATSQEIKEKLNSKEPLLFGDHFKLYVGNLLRKVDSNRLKKFFSKHGKVADARVMRDRKTGRSRVFSFF